MPQIIRETGIDDIHRTAAQYRYLTGQETNVAAPTLTSISPTTKVAGAAQFTLTATGTGFISGRSQIVWGADPVATTFVSATSLTAVITADKVAVAGDVLVTVLTAGLTTQAIPFTITAAFADEDGVPDEGWLKADIVGWLLVQGVDFTESALNSMTKVELLDLVDAVVSPPPTE